METSARAWLVLPGSYDKGFARRVRWEARADLSASGATRVAGSLNFKDKYAPDFPRVTIREVQPGHRATTAELDRLSLVAPPDEFAPMPPAPRFANPRIWPSYQKALDGAPRNRAGDGGQAHAGKRQSASRGPQICRSLRQERRASGRAPAAAAIA